MKPGETYMAGLASEFFVASQLLRQGYSVSITLGNTKQVDLAAHDRDGNTVTIDVKGLKNTTNWPLVPKRKDPHHFYVFVAYHNRFADLGFSPETYVVPSIEIAGLLEQVVGAPKSDLRFLCPHQEESLPGRMASIERGNEGRVMTQGPHVL